MNEIILFTHIGKTGGNSLHQLFRSNFKGTELVGDHSERDFFYSVNHIGNDRVRCISGHFSYGLHRLLLPHQRALYVVMLRNPLDTILSYYFYRRELHEHHRTAEAWLRSPNRGRNDMCSRICGYGFEPGASLALQRLQRDYAVFGITEMFDESVFRICSVLGLPRQQVPRINTNEARPKFSPKEQTRLQAIVYEEDREDCLLYEGALKLFRMGPSSIRPTPRLEKHTQISPYRGGRGVGNGGVADV